MDELMAAMVLSSLSCSPLLHSPAHPDATGTRNKQTATQTVNPQSNLLHLKILLFQLP